MVSRVSHLSHMRNFHLNEAMPEIDEKSRRQWERLGLPIQIVNQFPDCVKFLLESRLIYAMLGFQATTGNPNRHGLRLNDDGHPLIMVQGQWMRWGQLKKIIEYDAEEDQIKTVGYSGHIAGIWNYLCSEGLTLCDRLHYDQPFPVIRLSVQAIEQLKIQAQRFYETNPETNPGVKKDCVLQFFTSSRREGIMTHPLLENFSRQYPVHIGIRLITANRNVYSFGYQLPAQEARQIADNPSSTLLKTGDARIGMLDYEEFRKHQGRLVTSIPITSQNATDILKRVGELNNKRQLRFNYARQNCSALMNELMPQEYHVDLRTTAKAALWGTVPSLSHIPYIGHLIEMVQKSVERIWNTILDYTPECIQTIFLWMDRIVFALPRECQTIASNLFLWKIGASLMTRPLEEGEDEEEVDPSGKIGSFSALFRSWTDFFKDVDVFHSRAFIEWQKRQHSTSFHVGGNLPKMEGLFEFPPIPEGAL